jgi:hypothetical protein
VVFIAEGQRTQADILRNCTNNLNHNKMRNSKITPTSVEYEQFVHVIGWEVDLEDHGKKGLFSGGLDTNGATLTNGTTSICLSCLIFC